MELTLESLIGLSAVLLLLALGLVAFLTRELRKNRAAATPSQAESDPDSAPQQPSAPTAPHLSEIATEEAPAPIPKASPQPAQPLRETRAHSPPDPGHSLVMTVWQDVQGSLVIEMDGRRYRRLFEIQDGTVGRRMLETIAKLVAFSKGQTSQPPQPASSTAPVEKEQAGGKTTTDPAAESQLLQEGSEPKPTKTRITMDPVPFRRRTAAQQSGITLNLAEEVDARLQVHVKASPAFAQRYIHVVNAPNAGLRFDIDGCRYDTIEAIPETAVQKLIRNAIADWESKG